MAGSTLNPLMSNSTIRSGHPSSLPQIQLQKLMMSYDAIIKQLNTYRKSKKPFPLLHYFSSQISGVSVSAAQANVGASALEKSMLARSGGSDEKTLQDLKQTYSLLTQLVAESADGSSPGERHYARIYTSEDPSDVLNKLVNNAKKYLEKEFEEYVNREIDIKKIQTGGVPGWGTRMAAWVSWEMQGGRDGNVPRIVNQLEVRETLLGRFQMLIPNICAAHPPNLLLGRAILPLASRKDRGGAGVGKEERGRDEEGGQGFPRLVQVLVAESRQEVSSTLPLMSSGLTSVIVSLPTRKPPSRRTLPSESSTTSKKATRTSTPSTSSSGDATFTRRTSPTSPIPTRTGPGCS